MIEELLLRKLGQRGLDRVNQFRALLPPSVLESLVRFLELAEFPAGVIPSVFFTDAKYGGVFMQREAALELSWEDSSGQEIQVVFRDDGIELFPASALFDIAERGRTVNE